MTDKIEVKDLSLEAWANSDVELYSQHDLYKAEIEPLVKQLYTACQKHNLPVVVHVCHTTTRTSQIAADLAYMPPQRTSSLTFMLATLQREGPQSLDTALHYAAIKARRISNPPTQN